jgi:hypothetical protein
MYLIQIKHTQIKIPLCSFWTVCRPTSNRYYQIPAAVADALLDVDNFPPALPYMPLVRLTPRWPPFLPQRQPALLLLLLAASLNNVHCHLLRCVSFEQSTAVTITGGCLLVQLLTDKNENQIFLICKEIQNGAVAKSYMRKAFLVYEEMSKYLTMYEGAVKSYMTLQLLHSEFPYI